MGCNQSASKPIERPHNTTTVVATTTHKQETKSVRSPSSSSSSEALPAAAAAEASSTSAISPTCISPVDSSASPPTTAATAIVLPTTADADETAGMRVEAMSESALHAQTTTVAAACDNSNSSNCNTLPPTHPAQQKGDGVLDTTQIAVSIAAPKPSTADAATAAHTHAPMNGRRPSITAPSPSRSPAPNRPAAAAALTLDTKAPPTLGSSPIRPLVICGPAGVGKGTIVSRLLKEFPHHFAKSVSHTTRKPREVSIA